MKANKILNWVLLGIGGAAITIIQQIVTNAEIKSQVDDAVEERFSKEEKPND